MTPDDVVARIDLSESHQATKRATAHKWVQVLIRYVSKGLPSMQDLDLLNLSYPVYYPLSKFVQNPEVGVG